MLLVTVFVFFRGPWLKPWRDGEAAVSSLGDQRMNLREQTGIRVGTRVGKRGVSRQASSAWGHQGLQVPREPSESPGLAECTGGRPVEEAYTLRQL